MQISTSLPAAARTAPTTSMSRFGSRPILTLMVVIPSAATFAASSAATLTDSRPIECVTGIVARSRPPSRVETGTPSGRPPERYAIDPHAMHDNSELASDSNLRFLQSTAFDQAKAPRFDSGPFLYSCQQ